MLAELQILPLEGLKTFEGDL